MTTSANEGERHRSGGKPSPASSVTGLAGTLAIGLGSNLTVAAIGILVVPAYLRLMGPEAYGLAAFYAVLLAWLVLFDFGLSPTISRQLSRFKGGALGAGEVGNLFRAAESFFMLSGLAACGVFFLASPWIASRWLGPSHIAASRLDLSLRLIGALLVCRWLAALYQSALIGLERQNVMNLVALAGGVIRYGGALTALVLVSRSPVTFFAVMLAATIAEAAAYRLALAGSIPRRIAGARSGWAVFSGEYRFAAGMIVSSALATLIAQADKLALSHALSLHDFGLFGLIVAICGGIAMVSIPFVQAFQPRLITLLAQGRRDEFAHVYRLSAALVLALTAGLAGAIAAQPEAVIYVWTGQRELGAQLAPALTLYAAGSGIATFLFVPFLLQYAQGKVQLHVIGNLTFAVVWVPSAVWAAFAYGAVGAGVVWLAGNLLYLALWVPVIHARWLTAEERRGLNAGVWLRGLMLAALLAATRLAPIGDLGRAGALVALAAIGLTVAALGVAASRELRAYAASALAHIIDRRR